MNIPFCSSPRLLLHRLPVVIVMITMQPKDGISASYSCDTTVLLQTNIHLVLYFLLQCVKPQILKPKIN